MLNLVVFETEEELCELTGLTEHELWQKGFNLDDWEIGFQSEVKLHKTPTKKDIANGYRENELIALFDLPAHWLMSQMNAYCVGANYVFWTGNITIQFIMHNMVKNGDVSPFFMLWLYNEVCNKRIESIICERI